MNDQAKEQPIMNRFTQMLTQIRAEQGYLIDLAADGSFILRLKLKADGTPIDADKALIIKAIADHVVKSGQALITRNAMTDRRFASDRNVMRLRIRSVICVPLWREQQIVSLVYVEHRTKRGQFNRNQVPLLEGLVDQTAQKAEEAEAQSPEPLPASKSVKVQAAPPQEERSEKPKSPHNRYILHEPLGQGGMGMVHRATDRLTGQIVALKQVHIPVQQLQFMSRLDTMTERNLRVALAQEFQIVAGLRHPHIISVLNYGFGASQQPYFTMTYLPEAQTLLEAGMARDQVGKVQLIREMLQALAYLHRRGIIHRDLKPSNVLVAENNLRVLDFGLSISQETKLTSAGGTLLYMAPELLNQQAATQASDLYAVGVMAYQLFAGRHPFDTTSYAFVDQVLYEAPDLTILGLDERLANVIARLLAKKPAERYVSAEACLRAIHAALGEAIPAESAAIRESYLQAATFVGREAEMAQLQAALTEAKDGQGAVWLVGGESGVGKSRLVAEFRTQALVSGWQVLTGQAIAEGGGPYHLWREIVRRLVLNTQLSDLEAGILYQVAPDIAHLLARPIPEPPELHGEAGQLRLVLTLVSIIQRQTQPTLLLVEDLQWAQESLAPLQQVLKVDGQMTALMVVGTYRNDERPNLPEILAGSQGFVLDRLTEPQIAQLSQAMLGKEASTARIVSLLTQETEGNTFFIVEVMRALAEEAGQLDEIGQMTLPAGVFTSGMQHLLQRRVQRIGVEDQALLKLAAIAGRQLDANLLQVLAPDTDIAAWLQRTSDAAILAVGDGQWLFAHDKLREAILAGLVAETQQDLHRQVAEAIEQLYPQDETYYEALLEQWHQAGDLDKEIHYLDPVVRHLIQVAIDYEQAHILLERSLQALAEDDARRVSIWNWQATFHQLQGNHDHAKRLAQQAQELATKSNNQSGLALTLKILGDFNIYYGDYTSASEYHQQSLTIYQKIRDQGNIANSLIRLGDMARFQGNFALARTYYQKTLKMGQSLNEKAIIAQSVNNLGIVAAQTGKYEQGRDYFQQALILRQAIGNQYAIASGLCNLGQITYDLGDYQQAYDYIQQSMVIAEAIGDQQTIVYNLTALAFLDIKLNNGQAKASLCKLLSVARSSQAIPTMLEALVGFIWLFLQQHNPVRAGELAGLTQHHPAHNSDVQQKLNEVLPLLSESLDGMELQAALERGKTFDLDTVVQALLSEFSNNQKDDKD